MISDPHFNGEVLSKGATFNCQILLIPKIMFSRVDLLFRVFVSETLAVRQVGLWSLLFSRVCLYL